MPLKKRTAAKTTAPEYRFGWIPPAERDRAMWEAHDESLCVALAPPDPPDQGDTVYTSAGEDVGGLPEFIACVVGHLRGGMQPMEAIRRCLGGPEPGPTPPPPPPPEPPDKRFALWRLARQGWGVAELLYVFQQTGSCVGASFYNALITLMGVEKALGTVYPFDVPWWPYTYGQGRYRVGMTTEGEGSLGSGQAAAAREDGIFGIKQTTEEENWSARNGWMVVPAREEYRWSAGAWSKRQYGTLARASLIKGVAAVKNTDEWEHHIRNNRTITLASMFGTRGIRAQGTPAVNVGEWNDQWPHQMYSDEVWIHPTLGRIFRIGNNWSASAHPAPTQGEPPGGFYILDKTAQAICKDRGTEVFAFDSFGGFKDRPEVARAMEALSAV